MKRILFFIAILIPFITFGQSEKVFVIADSTLADQWTTLGNIWRYQKGDDMNLTGTAVFTNNKETNHGIIALVLDSEKVALAGMAMIGWKRLGISRKVTKSKDKLLYSIDDKPAVDMYLKYLGRGGDGLGEKILNSITHVAGNNVTIWGGGAGDDLIFKDTFVFNNTNISNQGILMLVLNEDKILVKGLAASGMKPMGTEKVITKSEGSWILEIDNQPATDLVTKYMGESLSPEDFKDFNLKNIFLNLLREDSSSIIRTTLGFNMDTKGIAVSGKIKPGDKFRFTFLPDFDVLNEVSENARQFQQTEMPEVDALVLFSCIGRIDAFGPMTSEELQGIQSVYNVPMAGFFSYGEYGRATGGNNEYHNMTCCWVALKEK